MQRLLDFFGSVRLTLGLLLFLALVAMGGTIRPVEQTLAEGPPVQRFDLYYQSPWFRVLLALLFLNLAVCTWRTIRRALNEPARLCTMAAGVAVPAPSPLLAAGNTVDELAGRLASAGFHPTQLGDRLLGRRLAAGRWMVPLLHLAVIVIMLGALAGSLGFVGTLSLYVTHQADSILDWESQSQRPLGFTLRLDRFEPAYYPFDLQIAIIDPVTRQLRQTITTREGATVSAGNGLVLRVLRFFPDREDLVLFLERDGAPLGEYHALGGPRDYPGNPDPGVLIKPLAYSDPMLKQLHSEVTVIENGREIRRAVIEVNQPLVHRGVAIYQTAYARDPNGFWYCGFQLSRDPGEPLVWGGCIILVLALLGVFLCRPQSVVLVPVTGGWQLLSLGGSRGEAGRRKVAELTALLES